ncbi:helix-turn-helix transcriptional regulator [Flexivirga lutea]
MHKAILTDFATTDPAQAHALVAEAYSSNQLRVSGSTAGFRFGQRRHDLGEVRLDRFHNTMTTQYSMEPLGCLVVCRMVRGTMDIAVDGCEQRLGSGQTVLVAPPHLGYRTRVHGTELELIGVDLSLLDRLVTEDDDEPIRQRIGRLVIDPLLPPTAVAWQRAVTHVTELAAADDVAAASPLVLSAAGDLLAATLLATFDPLTAQHHTGSTAPSSGSRDTVRRADAYLESNPDLDLGVADIARACHVSVRALQAAYRRELDTTPMARLRRIRLDRVRTELAAADPHSGVTVGAVAGRWGFTHRVASPRTTGRLTESSRVRRCAAEPSPHGAAPARVARRAHG